MAERGKPRERKSVSKQEVRAGAANREVNVEYYVPEGLGVTYVDNLTAIHTSDIFILTYFQVEPPVVMNSQDRVDAVSSKAVIQLAITPRDMEKFLDAMQKNLELYKNTYIQQKGGDEK